MGWTMRGYWGKLVVTSQASLDLKFDVKVNGLEIAIDCADCLRAVALGALAC
ncbi:MAG: hypothetical protein MP439_11150 [Ferrimicrobium sp.]|jgi:hypothetical protein|nr:hypothetical protein [Ferrimicrobium sp.]